ncbi:MAG: class 3 adenylate cyclase, partial [Gammaproteobacteria bacterium]
MSEAIEKSLVALMFTDLVGSVALQQRLGTAAYMRYVGRHDEIFQQCLAEASDARVLNESGDGFLVRFDDPSDAVSVALRLQFMLHQEVCQGERIRVRIGLHLGVVTEMEERIRGEKRAVGMPINLTARIMDLAEGGQILMTRAVYEDARHHVREHPVPPGEEAAPELEWLSHGSYEFKGNPEPMELFEAGAKGIAPFTAPQSGDKATRVGGSDASGRSHSGRAEVVAQAPTSDAVRDSDVVITYAGLDDQPVVSGRQGWVSQLHENLQVRVAQLSGKQVAVLKLPDAFASEENDRAMLEQVPQAKTVISVLSPPFAQSDRCQRVVETFWRKTQESGRFEVDQRSRLLNVVKTPVDEDDLPASIRGLYTGLAPYEFFERDPVSGRMREFDESFGDVAVQRFHERVYDVAYDVSQVLKHLGAPRGGEGNRSADPKTIFLAATTSDLEPQRDQLRRELIELGHAVIPRQPLPLVAGELMDVVRGCLEHADIAIHLVGEHFGLVPEATELSVVALQNQVAAEFCGGSPLRRLIWVQRGLQPSDPRQASFLRQLESEPESVTGAELIADTLENLKVLLLSRWEKERVGKEKPAKPAIADDVRRLYLICDQQDEEAVEPLEDYLYAQGIEVGLPAFGVDESETQQIHIQNLSDCDAVLIYYGAASSHWVDFKVRDLQKAMGYRDGQPIAVSAVYLAPPTHRRKERFRSVLTEVLRQEGESFDPAVLEG